MLQRQIMFKQLQRRQQLQELGNMKNQNYANQLSWLNHTSREEDCLVDSSQQSDISLFANTDKNLDQYSHVQVPSNGTLQPAALSMNQPCTFPSNQISAAGRSMSMLSGRDNSGVLSVNYSEPGITMQSGHCESEACASLDPLEQKILYSVDDNGWKSSFGGLQSMVENVSQMDSLPSKSGGSWSALMQSAVAETSSSDTGIQEEWSGLNNNQPQDFIDRGKMQNSWVDRNSQSASSVGFSSFQQPGNQYPGQNEEYQSGLSHDTARHSPRNMSQLADYNAQQKYAPAGSQPIQTSLRSISSGANENESLNNLSGHDFRSTFWLQGSTSYDALGGIEKPSHQGASNATSVSSHYVNDYFKNQYPVAFHNSPELKIPNLSGQEFPILETFPVTQPNMLSSSLFQSPDSASSSRDELHNQNPFQHEHYVQDFSKYDNVNYPQSIASAKELPFGGLNFGVSQNEMNNQSTKASPMGYHHKFQENDKASNLMYQSNISSQMAPTWFKQYGSGNNGQILPMHDFKASVNAGSLQENSLIMANTSEQDLAVPIPKKRKLVSLDMIPWHKEVNHEQPRLQDISTAELAWAQASNRKQEEVINEAEVIEELRPVIRAKRRLMCTTQLMQQVFGPAPAVILRSDGSSSCNLVIYFAARFALGDACGPPSPLSSEASDMSSGKVKTSKRTNACKFVEGFISRVRKLEDDLSRMEKTLSLVDMKVETQELEKFSLINRFAKFHIRAHSTTTLDPATSSTFNKANLQKYVVGVAMPKKVPEVIDCLSL